LDRAGPDVRDGRGPRIREVSLMIRWTGRILMTIMAAAAIAAAALAILLTALAVMHVQV